MYDFLDIQTDEGHGKFNVHIAIKMGKKMEPFEPYFFEELTPLGNVDAMAKVAVHLNIPISIGERIYNKFGFRELLERQAVDFLQPDVSRTGGITELKKIAAMAEAYYVNIAPHNPDGPIANYASIHVLASIPNCAMLEWVRTNPPWFDKIITSPLHPKDGFVGVPNRPGLGVDLMLDVVSDHLFKARRG